MLATQNVMSRKTSKFYGNSRVYSLKSELTDYQLMKSFPVVPFSFGDLRTNFYRVELKIKGSPTIRQTANRGNSRSLRTKLKSVLSKRNAMQVQGACFCISWHQTGGSNLACPKNSPLQTEARSNFGSLTVEEDELNELAISTKRLTLLDY